MNRYSELYVYDAQKVLATAFHFVTHNLKKPLSLFVKDFINSKYCKLFEDGNPRVLGGMSGIELVMKIYDIEDISKINKQYEIKEEYWLGYVLAYYEWYSGRSFKDIFFRVSIDELLKMYKVYHEMDIMRFVEALDKKIEKNHIPNYLQYIRKQRGLSQSQLAKLSNVNNHMIQLYEQGVNDLNKAQVNTLYRLSRALCCHIEDLLIDYYQ